MRIEDLTVEVRNASLQRVGMLPPTDLVGAKFILRYNNVGFWSIPIAATSLMADTLRTPGTGIIVTGPDGVMFSGPMLSAKLEQTVEDSDGTWVIEGTDDSIILTERLAYPTPTTADVTAQDFAYDVRSGVAETVMKNYVLANIGSTAPTARKITTLAVGTDLGRGSTVVGNARFETLQDLLYPLAQTGGLGYSLEQSGSTLLFEVFVPTDRSATIRLDIENNKLSKSEYFYQTPKTTRAIIAGAGAETNRIMYEGTSTSSLDSETVWGRRIERFVDSRDADTTTELTQAASEALVDDGKTIVNLNVVPNDDLDMAFGVDWFLGDRITVVSNSVESTAVVTEVGISIEEDGVRLGTTIGTPTPIEFEAKIVDNQISQDTRISNLERNNDQTALTLKQLVNNRTGSTLTKGQVVYITGAQGNRVTVALAKADAEATSSKTMGVVEADILNNQSGYVITEGSIQGLNTSALTEGAALWLSATTAGAYTETKTSAPNNLVAIGIVERVQSTNGSIFVKIANGFELDELHTSVKLLPIGNAGTFIASQSSGTPTTGTLQTDYVSYAVPIYLAEGKYIDQIGVEVPTSASGSVIRLGIYSNNPATGKPNTLVVEAGTVSAGTTGVKTITIASTFLVAGFYWLVAKSDVATNAYTYRHSSPYWPMPNSDTNTSQSWLPVGYRSAAGTSGSALPASFGTATVDNAVMPLIFIRVA